MFGSNRFATQYFGQGNAALRSVSLSQVAATLTATGGTQTVSATPMVNVALNQVAATVTATGGNQAVATVNDVALSQIHASLTLTGGSQSVATVNNVSLAQTHATITATGGVQTLTTINDVSLTQVYATITATTGTQTLATVNDVSLAQVHATLTATGGIQTLATVQNQSLSQVGTNVTAIGGNQAVSARVYPYLNISLSQVGAVLMIIGGIQTFISQNFPSTKSAQTTLWQQASKPNPIDWRANLGYLQGATLFDDTNTLFDANVPFDGLVEADLLPNYVPTPTLYELSQIPTAKTFTNAPAANAKQYSGTGVYLSNSIGFDDATTLFDAPVLFDGTANLVTNYKPVANLWTKDNS